MDYAKLKVAREGAVEVITLNDPATLNAAGVDLAGELRMALDKAAAPGEARAIVITGEGRGFCSGANLAQTGGGGGERERFEAGSALERVYNPLVTAIRDLPVPLITAINGPAAGVGCSIALMGDLIVAGESAYFLQAFRRIGLIPDGGSTYILPRLIGRARAMEMALLGEKVSAAQALEWGLINRCVPDDELMPTAMKLAEELARGPASLGLIRQTIWASLDSGWSEQLHREAVGQARAGRSEDFREGVRAFLEKRPAVFQGR